MSKTDDLLQAILDTTLKEHKNLDKKILDSELSKKMEKENSEVISKSANILLKHLKSKIPEKLEENKRIEKEFEKYLMQTWATPLDLLDLLLYFSLEAASQFNKEYRSEASSKDNYLYEVLIKQHARACLVCNEIIHLLKSGFPDGAHARWRTLHEIACTSYLISKHGQDLAKRFLDYEKVESYYQALAFQEHCRRMEYKPLSEKELKIIKKQVDDLRKLYGKDFLKNYPYGWVPRDLLKTRSLKEIEKAVKLDRHRPYYDMAGYNAHSGPKGLAFKLGIKKDDSKKLILLTGPTNYGLADPGQALAISLGQITACLLLTKPTLKRLIIVEAMRTLVSEICEAFCKVQDEFEKAVKTH